MKGRAAGLIAILAGATVLGCGTSGGSGAPSSAAESAAITHTASTSPSSTSPSPSPEPSMTSIALPQGSDAIELDPARFAGVAIDHPFWPMTPGSRWVYRETDADGSEQDVEVTVTAETKEILGIAATVVHDVVSVDGEAIEDTYDWYAQDAYGNLWYLGEATKEYENGEVVSTRGSWEAGVDGAQAGIILPADPRAGMTYRQEYYAGEAEDAAEVLSLDEYVEVPFGAFDGCLQTKDFTALDPEIVEHKFYARGVGPVQVIQVSGGSSREDLVAYERG